MRKEHSIADIEGEALPSVRQQIRPDDAIRYALSIGIGRDPFSPAQLRFTYEKDLRVFPTMAHVLGWEEDWIEQIDFPIEPSKLLHLSSKLVNLRDLPLSEDIMGRSRISKVFDRGPDRGALIVLERSLTEEASGLGLAAIEETLLLRNAGGFGGKPAPKFSRHERPGREPDFIVCRTIMPQAALLYRLNFDRNPLHVDPDIARSVGFDRPILHGACTQAMAADAVVEALCNYEASRLSEFQVNFLSPTVPGARLQISIWELGENDAYLEVANDDAGKTVLVGRTAISGAR